MRIPILLAAALAAIVPVRSVPVRPPPAAPLRADASCPPTPAAAAPAPEEGPAYYAFPLVTTKNLPGTGLATGTAAVSVPPASPFSVALGPDGSYRYRVDVALSRMDPPGQGRLVAWASTVQLDRVHRLGDLDDDLRAWGEVGWNKFLVVVTLEDDAAPEQETWSGPVVFRGMSRSGMMHTMVGHGALQQENCVAWGYEE